MAADIYEELAVVVGATGVLGTAIVNRLLSTGLDVVAVARSNDALADLRQRYPGGIARRADIAADSAIDAIRAVLEKPVRMVVHGSGVAVAGGILTAPVSVLADAVNIKASGLLRLVRQLSLAYGERGITAHLIAPVPTHTERLARVAADRAARRGGRADSR